jgi:hypothetical protein
VAAQNFLVESTALPLLEGGMNRQILIKWIFFGKRQNESKNYHKHATNCPASHRKISK